MKEATLIDLTLIDPNPYQVREREDPEKVAEIAASIEKNGLLQYPTVRMAEGERYQLAFGHTRLAAYKSLEAAFGGEYAQMPCFVRKLDDLQMFEQAVAENIKRRDMNPVEVAAAMKRYMDFGKTSEETGEFFGVAAATVRGTVRLLGLPETVKQSLSEGTITVGAARQILTVAQVAPDKVDEINKRVASGGDVEEATESVLKAHKNVVTMSPRWDKENPKAGKGLWELAHTAKKFPPLPALTAAEAVKAIGIDKEAATKREVEEWISQLEGGLVAAEALAAQVKPEQAWMVDELEALVNPPSCLDCSAHLRMSGEDYCVKRACWSRKVEAYIQAQTAKKSKESGIAVYDPGKDGKYIVASRWGSMNGCDDLLKAPDPGLRLLAKYDEQRYDGLWNDKCMEIVDVDPERVKAVQERKESQKTTEAEELEARKREAAEREITGRLQEAAIRFRDEVAVPVFATCLKAIKPVGLLRALMDYVYDSDLTDEDGNMLEGEALAGRLRVLIMGSVIESELEYSLILLGPVATAEGLAKLAQDWAVKLPTDWTEQADAYWPEDVQRKVKKGAKGEPKKEQEAAPAGAADVQAVAE